jgi:hypothetical protein
MLSGDIDRVNWPASGEIDILEYIGREPKTAYGTLHGPGYSGGNGIQGKTTSDTLNSAFHDYAVEWSPEKIVWTLDGKPFHTLEAKDVGNKGWPFERPFFVILNLAVGGQWPGYPDATTVLPQRLVVDHVRVWKDANLKVDEEALAKRHRERMATKTVYKGPGPQKVPGVVRLADFIPGGEGIGYHDIDSVNEGGAYREDEGVDLGASGPEGIPYSIGWTQAGEWLTYAIDVAETGNYSVELTAASQGVGGIIALEADGKPAGTASVPDTGNGGNWKPLPMGTVRLTKGRHTLKLLMRSAGPSGSVGNVATLRFTRK